MTQASSQLEIEKHVEALIEPLAKAVDAEYIGEPISQLAHALQCADWASRKGAPEEVIIACLFHDVGHLIDDAAPQMDGLGVLDHETLGGDFLRSHGIPERVAKLVEAHVSAKRYLCCRKPAYYRRLSPASKGTLEWQGGPMSDAEATAFEQDPDFKYFLALRNWDELAKEPDACVPDLDHYRPMIAHLIHTNPSQPSHED